MFFNLPTLLTWTRIVAIPLIVGVFYLPLDGATRNLVATVMFVGFAATDWLDGWLARRLNQTSAFGAFLDPVADKLIVAVALVLIVHDNHTWWMTVTAAVIIGREIAISALREWMAEIGARRKVAVSSIGKFKTIFQIVGLSMLLYREDLWFIPIYPLGVALTVLAAVLTLWSMVAYLRAAWPDLTSQGESA